jgi:hypothetical protein
MNLSPTFKGSKIDAKKKKFSPFLTLSIVIIIKVLKIWIQLCNIECVQSFNIHILKLLKIIIIDEKNKIK